jgi:hypothetical protein
MLFVLPNLLITKPKIYHLGHGYRILVVLLPNILFSSLLTNYRSPLTAHKIALPGGRVIKEYSMEEKIGHNQRVFPGNSLE